MIIGEWHTREEGWRHLKHEAEFRDYCIRPVRTSGGYNIVMYRPDDDKFLLVELTVQEVDALIQGLACSRKRSKE